MAGLEALLALRDLANELVDVTLVAPEPDFVYKPLAVDEPFSAAPPEHHELAPLARELGVRFVQEGVGAVRAGERTVELGDASTLSYDALLVCIGGRERAAYSRAVTFWAAGEWSLDIDGLLERAAASSSRRIAFIVPPGVTWSLPLYELALMSERRARSAGISELELLVVTPEATPLVIFGPAASEAVAELLAVRGIQVLTSTYMHEEAEGFVTTPGHRVLEAGAAIALPAIDGPALDGLPADDDGFIPIDEHARVKGVEDVYAAGDGTTFPIKQGGIATQEADAAAEHIAARFGAPREPEPFRPVLRGKLITGEETLSMRAAVAGGAGEGVTSVDYLWWPPHKVSGRYLAPFLAGSTPHREPEPPGRPLDVEVSLPVEWHREPMALDPYGPPQTS